VWKWLIAFALFFSGALTGYFFAIYQPIAPHVHVRTVELSVRDGEIYHVRKVIDGDTLVLDNGLHVRYSGINAPETGHFVKDASPLAIESTQRNVQLVESRRIRLRLPKEPLDIHGRLLAHIEIIPESPNDTETDPRKIILKEGLARVMGLGLEADQLAEYKSIEADAKTRKVGLWGLEEQARNEGAGKPYIAASTGTVYHLRMCKTAHVIKAANRHEYTSAEEAEHAGYKPCARCVLKEP
jgi:micrococcal nuclease